MHTQMSQRLSFMRMTAPFFHWRSTPLCLMSCNALWWSFMTGPALPLMSTRLDENFSPKRIGRWKIFPPTEVKTYHTQSLVLSPVWPMLKELTNLQRDEGEIFDINRPFLLLIHLAIPFIQTN